ncbi:MAG: hypothetical protein EXR77_15500 [Myxococcales bacterium]|nr:hypothetical protein [Myxococcales bacterium]
MRVFPWGDAPMNCNLVSSLGCTPAPPMAVDARPLGAGPYGHEQLVGNAWELAADFYSAPFATTAVVDPGGPATASYRAVHGGGNGSANTLRSSSRSYVSTSAYLATTSFRCARSL